MSYARLGWCFYGDVWGFEALVSSNPNKAFAALKSVHEDIANHTRAETNTRTFLLSDSIFICSLIPRPKRQRTDASFDDFVALLEFVITKFWENDLPLRGAVTLGHIRTKNQVLLGQPIAEAVRLEQQRLLAPLIVVPFATLLAAHQRYKLIRQSTFDDLSSRLTPRL